MKFKALILLSTVFLSGNTYLKAQMNTQSNFFINGTGRSVISDNRLAGDALIGNAKTPSNGVSGYTLFDLKPTIKVGDNLTASVILRAATNFGAFFGNGNQASFRQMQISGQIKNLVFYEIGDINIGEGMSKYSVNNFDDLFYKYESQVFTQRRQIQEYENFNFGNKWRLQGAHARSKFALGTAIDSLGVYGFVVRTRAAEGTVADRILTGGRLSLIKNNMFTINGNYVGLLDIPVATVSTDVYKNQVVIGDATYLLDLGAVAVKANIESGLSSYDFTSSALKAKYSDYFYDGTVNANVKGFKVNVFGSYRNVGPEFYNPSAQTRRVNTSTTPDLFSKIGTDDRSANLFDRYSNVGQYNRVLSPTLGQFSPIYNNLSPYGAATPNRTGMTFGLATDTSTKIISADIKYEMFKEIIGENTKDLRSFNVITTGASFDLGKFIASERKYLILVGYRNEATSRAGLAAVDLKTNLLDAGLSFEVLKKLDLLIGYKKLTSKGKELSAVRNEVNLISSTDFNNYNIGQDIFSTGVNVRFSTNSFLNLTYNVSNNTTGISAQAYKINQFFMNLTVIL